MSPNDWSEMPVTQLKLRAANLLDIARIEQIHREAVARFSAVPPPARLWGLVSQTLSALLPLSQETLIYVAEEGGKVVGFVQAAGQAARTSARSPPGWWSTWSSRRAPRGCTGSSSASPWTIR